MASLGDGYLPEKTVHYKTYVKTSLVEAIRPVFGNHRDKALRKTTTEIDFPKTLADYPTVIVRFFEREIFNAGVGHEEVIDLSTVGLHGIYRFKHYFYKGDIEFAIYGITSLDRDLVADTIVQTITMGNLAEYTNRFFTRIYPDEEKVPDSVWHYININTDRLSGFGEDQGQTPWGSEDDLIYQTSYRVPVFGEFYSVPPEIPAEYVAAVSQYPYIEGVDPVPEGDPNDGGEWIDL